MKKLFFASIITLGIALSYGFKDDLFEISKQLEIFTTLYKELNINYVDEISPAKLMNSAVENMLTNLDPFTNFYNEQDLMLGEMEHYRNYSGIGAEVVLLKNKLLITEVYKSYPADLAGLKPGDEITQVDGVAVKSFEGNPLELLKGEKGSKVTLEYSRQAKTSTITLNRDNKTLKTVPFYGKIKDVGYITLTHFDQKASENVREALSTLKQDGINGIILDLRNNPGGLLNEAVEIVNLFTPKGQLVVTTKSKVKAYNKVYNTKKQAVDSTLRIAVIINGRSASASEIVSGAIQDLDRGVVLGKTSYGKGLVQKYIDLPYGTKMKVTISRYYTPSGRCIQALDYSQKNPEGEAKRIDKKFYNTYKTKNGRPIHDQGGITPDINTGTESEKFYMSRLVESFAVFDFATNYYHKNPTINIDNFNLKAKDLEDFKNFMMNREENEEMQIVKDLKKAMTKGSLYQGKNLKTKFEELLKALKTNDLEILDTYKTEITKHIEDEIIRRYLSERDYYQYKMAHDTEIQKAIELLSDRAKYNNVLNIK